MIEATCSACGVLNHIAETEIPLGAKFVNCASCKSRVAIPTKTAMGGSPMKGPATLPTKTSAPERTSRPSGPPIDLADLPAPKRSSGLTDLPASRPAPRSGLAAALDAGDLPAPKGRGQSASLDLSELAPPRGKPAGPQSDPLDLDDLLAPTGKAGSGPGRFNDPAPKGGSGDIVDLPAPKRSGGVTDLPVPKGGIVDLPTPKGGAPRPGASKAGATDLLTPRGPKPTGPNLPAPKGFFDDLPQSAGAAANARPDLPAPKGFFDDLPGRPNAPSTQNVAPKGFFEDLPGRPNDPSTQNIAPKGFFDDLPGYQSGNQPGNDIAPKGFFEDVPQVAQSSGSQMVEPARDQFGVLEPKHDEPGSQELALSPYGDELDLSKPSTGAAAQRYETPARSMDPVDRENPVTFGQQRGAPPAEMSLELVVEAPRQRSSTLHVKPVVDERAEKARERAAHESRQRSRRTKVIGGVFVGVLALGGGGFFLYHRHQVAVERQSEIGDQLGKARDALVAPEPGHWARAVTAAKRVLDFDDENADALSAAAEASLAGAYDEGRDAAARAAAGRKFVARALAAGASGPSFERAQALEALAMYQPDRAIAKLAPLLKQSKDPKDANLALYLGWAQSAKGDQPAAVKSFDTALAMNPAMKIPVLYARGRAKYAMADLEGARADFSAILAVDKAHVGAQVGQASAQPSSKATQQEAELLAILQRKDLDTGDPRAVFRAWVLAADDATRAGRLDAARDRYHKALDIDPQGLAAQAGLAEVELRDNKLSVASELILKALTLAPDDVRSQLVACQISIRRGDLNDAAARVKALAPKMPLLSPLEQGQIQLVTGKLLEAKGQDDAAVDAFVAGAKIVADIDLSATIAAVNKLSQMAQQATDPKRAEALRGRINQLLGEREAHAKDDPELSLTLGTAYLESDNATQAEPWLRRSAEARPADPDAQFQLAKAYIKLDKITEALALLKKASDLDPGRVEIGLELARGYELANRDDDAAPLYAKLLDSKEPSIALRSRAGRFYARIGQMSKASDQGKEILKLDPPNAAGMYLKGEGLLEKGNFEGARKAFQLAVQSDRDPQYLDALGRASQAQALASGDGKFNQLALQSYEEAAKAAPKMYNAQKQQGLLLVQRHESKKALEPLMAAWELSKDAGKKDPEVAQLMGSALQDLNDIPQAIQWLQVANDLKPGADASRRLGELYSTLGKGKEAEKEYGRAVVLGVAQEKETGKALEWLTDALYELGKLRLDLGDRHGAHVAWYQFINRSPPPPVSARTNLVNQKLNGELKKY